MSKDVLYISLSITVVIHFKCNEFLMIICLFHFLIWRFSDSSNHSYQNYDNSTDILLLKFTSIVCNVYQIVKLFNCLYIRFIKRFNLLLLLFRLFWDIFQNLSVCLFLKYYILESFLPWLTNWRYRCRQNYLWLEEHVVVILYYLYLRLLILILNKGY